MMNNVKYPSFPYVVGWSITNMCNLKCVHCNMDSGKAWANELTTEECKRVIDELAYNRVKTILFTGGEPLLRGDFFEIVDYALEKQINVSVTTNGTLVTDEIIKDQFWKFQAVRISIDSCYEIEHDAWRGCPGTYDKAISCIKKMKTYGYNVSISTCVSKRNIDYLDEMANLFEGLGVSRWCLPLLSPDGRGKQIANESLSPDEVKRLIYILDKIRLRIPSIDIGIDIPYIVLCNDLKGITNGVKGGCPAGISELTIFANGDVSPCFAMVQSSGNVREKTISEIWQNGKLFEGFRNRQLLKGKCHECHALDECGGGCRANPYIMTGDYLAEDEVCWLK